MRVVHLSTTDFWEQGLGAYRIHKGIQEKGIDSFMITLLKNSGDSSVGMLVQDPVYKNKFKVRDRISLSIPTFFTDMLESWREELNVKIMSWEGEVSCSLANSLIDWNEIQEVKTADIIHIHWTPGMLNVETMPLYFMEKPVVITCYDFSPFTGICHYPEGCNNFKKRCDNCPMVEEKKRYIVEEMYSLKHRVYNLINTVIVAQNRIVERTAKIFFDNVKFIPPATPFHNFFKNPRKNIRKTLGLPEDVKIIISVASSMANPRKGFENIFEIAERINSEINIYVILIGSDMHESKKTTSFPVHKIGLVPCEEILSWYYAASDVFVLPGKNDTFSLFALDAMAMGLPVVAFEGNGMDDIIISGKNGYIVPKEDIDTMGDRILDIFYSPKKKRSMERGARNKIKRGGLTLESQAEAYVSLYKEVIKNKENVRVNNLIKWGEELFVNNKRELALKLFEKILEIDKDNPDVLNNIGVIYWEGGMHKRAREYFKRAYKIAPENVQIRKNYLKSLE